MASEIKMQKTVSSKEKFTKLVDTSFTTFVDPQQNQDGDTVEELFRLYAKLYYEIPIEGDTNSHQYLVQESSKLVEFDRDTEDIQPLLDEITELRQRVLEAQQTIVELQTSQITNATN